MNHTDCLPSPTGETVAFVQEPKAPPKRDLARDLREWQAHMLAHVGYLIPPRPIQFLSPAMFAHLEVLAQEQGISMEEAWERRGKP